jgi:hypothetical protein
MPVSKTRKRKPSTTPRRARLADGQHDAAALLHAYMEARARDEGVTYGLDTAFFCGWLAKGVRTFFGVTLDAYVPKILQDVQNPLFLARYQRGDA